MFDRKTRMAKSEPGIHRGEALLPLQIVGRHLKEKAFENKMLTLTS
jgi:hypothetical protein